mgnify:CR=1 FL=1
MVQWLHHKTQVLLKEREVLMMIYHTTLSVQSATTITAFIVTAKFLTDIKSIFDGWD